MNKTIIIMQSASFLLLPLTPKRVFSPLIPHTLSLQTLPYGEVPSVKPYQNNASSEVSVRLVYYAALMDNRISTFRRNMVTLSCSIDRS
jgi:hypothetical protein